MFEILQDTAVAFGTQLVPCPLVPGGVGRVKTMFECFGNFRSLPFGWQFVNARAKPIEGDFSIQGVAQNAGKPFQFLTQNLAGARFEKVPVDF